jgi:Fe-S-cluster containining protein
LEGPRRFSCTACGKCCYGQVPLSLKDALRFAGLFPIGIAWTPVQRGSRDFRMTRTLGVTLPFADGRELASLIVPTAWLPAAFHCPALVDGKLCGIHAEKPARCKSMPFYPYREERFQGDFLKPREGWECDVSGEAPIVYDGKTVLQREDFDREKLDLMGQVPDLRRYADYMLKYSAGLAERLWAASAQEKGAKVVTSLSSLLTALRQPDSAAIARKQRPVLETYIAKTAEDPRLAEFHAQYFGWAKEMAYLAQG